MEGISISKTKSNMASKKPNACESWCFSYPLEIYEGRIDLLTQRDLEFWVNSKPTHNLHALLRMKTFYKPMTFHSYSKLAKGCIYQALEILPQEWRWKGLQYRSCPRGGSACIPRRSTCNQASLLQNSHDALGACRGESRSIVGIAPWETELLFLCNLFLQGPRKPSTLSLVRCENLVLRNPSSWPIG